METIRETIVVAEADRRLEPRQERNSGETPAGSPVESELSLRIRMAASRLIGIALIDRDPAPESARR